jgi:hypothetical protein
MAIVKVIEINANTSKAKKDLESLNETLDEQRQILIELEKELVKTEQLQATTSKTNLAAQKQLTKQANHLKDAIKDQKLGLRTLNVERRTATQSVKELSSEEANQSKIVKLLDTVTGGYATKAIKLYNGFKEGAKGLKSFNIGLGGMKKALIATGIGALVVAVGTLIAYWDDITGAINGASSEQTKLLDESKELVKSNQDILSATEASENTLRMQGKSEKEILALKIKQTDEVIAATEIQLQQQKDLKKSQTEAAERNQKIAAGIIAFLSLPVTILLGAVDALTSGLAKIGVLSEATNFTEKFAMGAASLIGFDAKDVEKEGAETVKETEKQLAALKNKRDGFRLTQQSDAKKDAEKAADKRAKELEEEFSQFQKISAIREQFRLKIEDLEDITDFDKRNRQYERDLLELETLGATEQQKLDLKKYYDLLNQQQFIENEDYFEELEIQEEDERLKRLGDAAIKEIAIAKTIAEAKEQIRDSEINNLSRGFQLLGQIAGKNKVLQAAALIGESAIGIAKIVINTQASNAAARLKYALIPGGLALAAAEISSNKVGAAIGIAANIAATAKGLSSLKASVSVPSAGGNSLSGGAGGSNAPVSQPPAFNVVGASNTNQLADAIGGQAQQPIKAFVVSNDVTSAQSMDRNIVSGASI